MLIIHFRFRITVDDMHLIFFSLLLCLPALQGSRDDVSVSGGVAGGVTRHGNSVDASFSKEVLNSITGMPVQHAPVCICEPIFCKKYMNRDNDDTDSLPSSFCSSYLHQLFHLWRLLRVTRLTPEVL